MMKEFLKAHLKEVSCVLLIALCLLFIILSLADHERSEYKIPAMLFANMYMISQIEKLIVLKPEEDEDLDYLFDIDEEDDSDEEKAEEVKKDDRKSD